MSKFIKPCALLLALLLLLTGCGGNASTESTVPVTTAVTEAAVQETTVPETAEATEPAVQTLYLLQTKTEFDANGTLTRLTSYIYDAQHRLLGYETTSATGELVDVREYTYYSDYREFSTVTYSTGEVTIQLSYREYLDEEGRLRKLETYRNGELRNTEIYNEQGNRQSMTGINGNYVWEYDEHGNDVARLFGTDPDSMIKLMEKTNTYDDQGRLSFQEEKLYNRETGTFETSTYCEYLYEGNTTTEVLTYVSKTATKAQGGIVTTITTFDENGNVLREVIQDEASLEESPYIPVTEYTYMRVEIPTL